MSCRVSGEGAAVSGASGSGDRDRVSGAVRVYVRKPGQRSSVRSGLPLCPTLFGGRVLGVETSDLTLDRRGFPPLRPALIGPARTHGYVPRKLVGNA